MCSSTPHCVPSDTVSHGAAVGVVQLALHLVWYLETTHQHTQFGFDRHNQCLWYVFTLSVSCFEISIKQTFIFNVFVKKFYKIVLKTITNMMVQIVHNWKWPSLSSTIKTTFMHTYTQTEQHRYLQILLAADHVWIPAYKMNSNIMPSELAKGMLLIKHFRQFKKILATVHQISQCPATIGLFLCIVCKWRFRFFIIINNAEQFLGQYKHTLI